MNQDKFTNILKLRDDQMKTMSMARRHLFLRVMDGFPDLGPVFFKWNQHERCEEVLKWLIQHRMTGKRLADYFLHQFGPRPESGFNWVISKIDGK